MKEKMNLIMILLVFFTEESKKYKNLELYERYMDDYLKDLTKQKKKNDDEYIY